MIAIPDWVPPSVTKEACALLKNGNPLGHDWRPVIIRLVTNVEMKKVWDELKKRKWKNRKRTKAFYHKAVLPNHLKSSNDPEERQGAALALIFGQAVLYAAFGTGQLLRPTPHHRKDRWEKMAKRLRRDASEVRLCGGEKFADHLLAAACAYEQLVWNPITDSGGWLFVASGGRDAEARGFSVLMAGRIGSSSVHHNLDRCMGRWPPSLA